MNDTVHRRFVVFDISVGHFLKKRQMILVVLNLTDGFLNEYVCF